MKRESEQVRQLRDELFRLGQIREHWKRLAEELGSLNDADRLGWLDTMRAESGL